MAIVEVGYHYTVQATDRAGRHRSEILRATMPVEIREVGAEDCPWVATVDGAGHHREGGKPAISTACYHAYAGGFVTAWDKGVGPNGLPVLAPPPEFTAPGVWRDDPCLFVSFGMSSKPRESLRWRGAFQSWEEVARAEVVERAARMCILNGGLMVPKEEPILAVRRYRAPGIDRVEVFPRLLRSEVTSSELMFALQDEGVALERARALAGLHGDIPVMRYGGVSLAPGWRMPYDGLRDYARDVLAHHKLDFASGAWLRHPDAAASSGFTAALGRLGGALPAAIAGEPAAIREGFESLVAMRMTYPANATTGIERLDALLRGGLDAALDYYRTHLKGRPLDADADAEALLALAPGR